MYVPVGFILHRAQRAGEFQDDPPYRPTDETELVEWPRSTPALYTILIAVLTAAALFAFAVIPLLETLARALDVKWPGFATGMQTIVSLFSVSVHGAILLIGPLQMLRPWREAIWLLARYGAGGVLSLCLTNFVVVDDFSFASIMLTLTAVVLVLAIIRTLDAIWASLVSAKTPDGHARLAVTDGSRSYGSPESRMIGIALSGGGYRASLFGLGALLYVREAYRAAQGLGRIVTISSVSGGSITNAVLAHGGGLTKPDDDTFNQLVAQLMQQATGRGSMFTGITAKLYYIVLLPLTFLLAIGLLWVGLPKVPFATLAGALGIIAGAVAFAITAGKTFEWTSRLRDKGSIAFARLLTVILLSTCFALSLAVIAEPTLRMSLALIAGGIAIVTGVAYVWSLRGDLIEQTFRRLLDTITTRARLADAMSDTHHVICATELQIAETVYFAQDAIRLAKIGAFAPGNLATARVVRASAAFPLAFPPVILPRLPEGGIWDDMRDPAHGEPTPRRLIMADGGVRDNLGTGWFDEYVPGLDALIVISAAPNRRQRRTIKALPGLSEFFGLLRSSFLPYESRERLQRRAIAGRLLSAPWNKDERSGGAIVHIEDSPFDLAILLLACDQRNTADEYPIHQLMGHYRRAHLQMLPDWFLDQLIATEQLRKAAGDHLTILTERARAVLEHMDRVEAKLPSISNLDQMTKFRIYSMMSHLVGRAGGQLIKITCSDGMHSWFERTSRNSQTATTLATI